MATNNSPISGVADRYARSLFDLARDAGSIDEVENTLRQFESLLAESADLSRLIRSPVFSAEDQERALAAVLSRAGLGGLGANFLRVVARNRRLFAVPDMIRAFRRIAAEARGESAAEVTTAHALTPEQESELRSTLAQVAGRQVTMNVSVDPSLLGGLVVKMGSRQIDTSLKTKLNGLKLALKEVG
ncbi:MAG: F0F1 ATP synthase subunit delta [Mesorhizobium amorphae]|nr:MAG: F0F1 ATP synthase subunit delta [Mesorhizobium amorphae]